MEGNTNRMPKSMSDEEWDFEHQQVCDFIQPFVDNNVYNHIASEIHFKKDTSLSDHLNEFQRILDQMSRMDIKFEDEILRLPLLNSLPESWETFKISITNSAPNGVVSLQMVKGSFLNEEIRRKAQSSSSQSEVLVTKNRERKCRVSLLLQNRAYTKALFLVEKGEQRQKGKSKEKDHDDDDDDCVTIAIGDDLVIF
ncbi:hypothetical protein CR513_32220, partial [Mucuna pruriens]